jgi:hypothetical protein
MKSILMAIAILTVSAFTVVNAQDGPCDSYGKPPVEKKVPHYKSSTKKYYGGNITTNVEGDSITFAPTIIIQKGEAKSDDDKDSKKSVSNTTEGTTAWPWAILGIVLLICATAYFSQRTRRQSVHDFISDDTIEALGGSGTISHKIDRHGSEKLRITVNPKPANP